jgi:hypothetical protein
MNTNLLKTCCVILFLCIFGRIGAQQTIKVIVTDVNNEQLQLKIEDNATRLLTEINSAYSEKRNLQIDRTIISPTAVASLLAIWEMSMFKCEKEEIIEKAINKKGGFEIRNIPIYIKEASEGENQEESVLIFNNEGIIDNFYISIGTNRVNEILGESSNVTDFRRRQIVLDFVENFRTAYNRRDEKFIQQVFSDDALIITGSVIKTKPQSTDMLTANLSNDQIRYTRLSKTEYLNGLKRVFKNNQYINIRFDSLEVMKHKKYPEIYGVTFKQHWNTTRYSDVGYVFLLIDFQDEENPIIHVRTWQPEKYANGKKLERDKVFGLGTFGDYNRK